MNKLMLGSALAVLALASAPAFAQDNASGVKLNLGGHFKGYVNYTDQDTTTGSDVNEIDILRQTEVHFGGETTLDNGLTVGAQIEALADAGDSFDIDESYAYFSGTWGRVNFGDEDGAAYLLQVAAPSADDNIDGIRQFIQPVNYGDTTTGVGGFPGTYSFSSGGLDYDNDFAGDSDKITYLTPVFSGFQAGLSYTPEIADASRATNGNSLDTTGFSDVWEVAGRYEGQFQNVGFIAGAGYTGASNDTAGQDDFQEWNVGLDLDIGAFGLGAVYTENNNLGVTSADNNETYVVGADYTTGPFKIGASYLNNDTDGATAVADLETDRYTGGVTYTYGPGMSFRGSVSYVDHDATGSAVDGDATSVLLGTQINF